MPIKFASNLRRKADQPGIPEVRLAGLEIKLENSSRCYPYKKPCNSAIVLLQGFSFLLTLNT